MIHTNRSRKSGNNAMDIFISLTRLSLSTILLLAMIMASSFTCTVANKDHQEYSKGNITIKWDILSWTPDGYVAVVTIYNFQRDRSIQAPGWTLGWTWEGKEVIWSMAGAKTTSQGDCSRFKGSTPRCCEKNPKVVDLSPEAPQDQQFASCCKGGVLGSWAAHNQNNRSHISSFWLTVGAAGTTTRTVKKPEKFTLVAPGPHGYKYACGHTLAVRPSRFISSDGRRITQAYSTWKVTCRYSPFPAKKTPTV